jgi:mono/diheme cytochrome c family protein
MKQDRKKGQTTHAPARSNSLDPEPSVVHGVAAPVWMYVALAVILFLGLRYLDLHAGGFNPHVYQKFASSNQVAKLSVSGDDPKIKGLAVYNMPTCVSCHQPNGQGTPGIFPALAGSDWVQEKNPARLIRIVLDGVQGVITVHGQPFGPSVMPPWRPTLNDEQIADVLSYVRTAWGNSAPLVKKDEVAAVRKETESHSGVAWTEAELLKVPVP